MSDSWDDYAAEWDSNQDVIHYADKAFAALTDVTDLADLNVLDFGCGTGQLTERIAPLTCSVVALDSSPKMISILNNKNIPNVTTVAAPLDEKLIDENPLLCTNFDLIVASSVCGFLPSLEQTLGLLKTLLVPAGLFIQWDWLMPDETADHGLSEAKVINAYQHTGLELQFVGPVFSVMGNDEDMPVLMGVARNAA